MKKAIYYATLAVVAIVILGVALLCMYLEAMIYIEYLARLLK